MKRALGFTLIEVLIATVLLGIVLTVASALFIQSHQISTRQISATEAEEDARLAILRMDEVLSQTAYLYPNGQTLTIPSGSVVTGDDAVAGLAPARSPYCPTSDATRYDKYCGFIYRLVPRSGYTTLLGVRNGVGDSVLIEQRFEWIDWPSNSSTPPTKNWGATTLASTGVIADAVDDANTQLDLLTVGRRPGIDTALQVDNSTTTTPSIANTDPVSLIQAVNPRVGLLYPATQVQRDGFIFARSVPRVAPPGTGVGN